MDDVMGDSGMTLLLGKKGNQYLYAFALISKGLVSLGRDDVERQRVKNRGFAVVRIRSLKLCHLPFKRLPMHIRAVGILPIDLGQRVDVRALANRDGSRACDLLSFLDCFAAGGCVAVLPKSVVVRHRNSPVRHRARWVLFGDFLES